MGDLSSIIRTFAPPASWDWALDDRTMVSCGSAQRRATLITPAVLSAVISDDNTRVWEANTNVLPHPCC